MACSKPYLTVQSNNKTIPSGCQGWDWPDGLGERWASAPSGDLPWLQPGSEQPVIIQDRSLVRSSGFKRVNLTQRDLHCARMPSAWATVRQSH